MCTHACILQVLKAVVRPDMGSESQILTCKNSKCSLTLGHLSSQYLKHSRYLKFIIVLSWVTENLNAGVFSAPEEVRGFFPSGCQGSNSGPQQCVLLPAEPSCRSFIEIFSSCFKLCFTVHTSACVSQGLETALFLLPTFFLEVPPQLILSQKIK